MTPETVMIENLYQSFRSDAQRSFTDPVKECDFLLPQNVPTLWIAQKVVDKLNRTFLFAGFWVTFAIVKMETIKIRVTVNRLG